MTQGARPAHPYAGCPGAEVPTAERRLARTDDTGAREPEAIDPLDPAARHMAQLAPPPPFASVAAPLTSPTAGEGIAPRARVSMEELLPQLVRRIAWAGDRHKGTVQLELGAGRHAGTIVTVHADAGRVRVELQGAGDVDALRARLDARLRKSGLDVESIT